MWVSKSNWLVFDVLYDHVIRRNSGRSDCYIMLLEEFGVC